MEHHCKFCKTQTTQQEREERTLEEAHLILQHDLSVRQVAKEVGFKKSTVHRDIHRYLPDMDIELYKKVREVLIAHRTNPEYNKNH